MKIKTLTVLACLLLAAGAVLADGGIAGTVTDARSGEPIAGALVAARGRPDAGRARTNARGVYVIEDLAPGRYEMSVSARGYVSARQGAVGVREGEITRGTDFALAPVSGQEPGAITGRVTDAVTGEPIRHAAAVAVSQGCRRRVRTDERGDYRLRGLEPGVYRVTAEARHYVRQTLPRSVAVRPGQTVENVNLALRPKPRPGAIAGTVTDARTGEPVAGAVVVARGEHGAFRARTDRHGHYRIPRVAPGSYRVHAAAHGYRPETFPRPVPVQPGQVTRPIDFRLRRIAADLD